MPFFVSLIATASTKAFLASHQSLPSAYLIAISSRVSSMYLLFCLCSSSVSFPILPESFLISSIEPYSCATAPDRLPPKKPCPFCCSSPRIAFTILSRVTGSCSLSKLLLFPEGVNRSTLFRSPDFLSIPLNKFSSHCLYSALSILFSISCLVASPSYSTFTVVSPLFR